MSGLLLRFQPEPTFREYVMRLDASQRLSINFRNFACDLDGVSLLDKVIHFEALREHFPEFIKELGIEVLFDDIPHLNLTQGRRNYPNYYDTETRNRIQELYSDDITRFGYKFDA